MSSSRRGVSRPPLGILLALVTTVLLALMLWGAAFWQLGRTAGASMTAPALDASVLACSHGPIGPGCTVRFSTPDGTVNVRTLDRPGLIGASTGEVVPVWVAGDGSVGVAGWRAWVDGLLLLGLAVFMTGTASGWLVKALRSGDELTIFDLVDDADETDLRRRDAG